MTDAPPRLSTDTTSSAWPRLLLVWRTDVRPAAAAAAALAAALIVGGCGSSSKPSSAGHPTTAGAVSSPGVSSPGGAATGSPAPQTTSPAPPPPPPLPRGGRTILPGHLVVAYYGIVGTSNILGQSNNPEADAAGVERQAAAYSQFGRPVQPAFELVTTVASASAGADGSYSSGVDPSVVQRYLDTAHRHKLLLVLDFQPGRAEFLPQVKRYERFLKDPSVGVALDPEWKLTASQLPNQALGSSSAASVNAVGAYLSAFVTKYRLPQKLFIVHEFHLSELPDRQKVETRPGLATVLQMDGLGPVSVKEESYRAVTADSSPLPHRVQGVSAPSRRPGAAHPRAGDGPASAA